MKLKDFNGYRKEEDNESNVKIRRVRITMKMKRGEGNESKVERDRVKIRRVRITMKMKRGEEDNESKVERDRVKI